MWHVCYRESPYWLVTHYFWCIPYQNIRRKIVTNVLQQESVSMSVNLGVAWPARLFANMNPYLKTMQWQLHSLWLHFGWQRAVSGKRRGRNKWICAYFDRCCVVWWHDSALPGMCGESAAKKHFIRNWEIRLFNYDSVTDPTRLATSPELCPLIWIVMFHLQSFWIL